MNKPTMEELNKAFSEIEAEDVKLEAYLFPVPSYIKTEEELENWIQQHEPPYYVQWDSVLKFKNLSEKFQTKYKEFWNGENKC